MNTLLNKCIYNNNYSNIHNNNNEVKMKKQGGGKQGEGKQGEGNIEDSQKTIKIQALVPIIYSELNAELNKICLGICTKIIIPDAYIYSIIQDYFRSDNIESIKAKLSDSKIILTDILFHIKRDKHIEILNLLRETELNKLALDPMSKMVVKKVMAILEEALKEDLKYDGSFLNNVRDPIKIKEFKKEWIRGLANPINSHQMVKPTLSYLTLRRAAYFLVDFFKTELLQDLNILELFSGNCLSGHVFNDILKKNNFNVSMIQSDLCIYPRITVSQDSGFYGLYNQYGNKCIKCSAYDMVKNGVGLSNVILIISPPPDGGSCSAASAIVALVEEPRPHRIFVVVVGEIGRSDGDNSLLSALSLDEIKKVFTQQIDSTFAKQHDSQITSAYQQILKLICMDPSPDIAELPPTSFYNTIKSITIYQLEPNTRTSSASCVLALGQPAPNVFALKQAASSVLALEQAASCVLALGDTPSSVFAPGHTASGIRAPSSVLSLGQTDSRAQVCVVCNEPGDKRCGKCQGVIYCSKPCQTSHWKEHKEKCKIMYKNSNL